MKKNSYVMLNLFIYTFDTIYDEPRVIFLSIPARPIRPISFNILGELRYNRDPQETAIVGPTTVAISFVTNQRVLTV